jgi:hypothetical protein
MKDEMVKFANADAKILNDLAAWLLTYEFEVASCGRPGEIEMAKIQALVPKALKSLVNYLE